MSPVLDWILQSLELWLSEATAPGTTALVEYCRNSLPEELLDEYLVGTLEGIHYLGKGTMLMVHVQITWNILEQHIHCSQGYCCLTNEQSIPGTIIICS
jgi:hypothetical protein